MAERKNFLLFAIGLGFVGVIIGGFTIYNMISDLLKP
jgi:hypothetical protein